MTMKGKNVVRAFAPATVANVCCGFDILGFAVEAPGDEVKLTRRTDDGIHITAIYGDGGKLPLYPEMNTAGVAIKALLHRLGVKQGVDIELHKHLPLGSGMGSSAASAVAALVAMNHLIGNPCSKTELIADAMEAERVACGSAHADNVAPSLLGGFALVRDYQPLDVVRIDPPENLFCTLIHPHLELKTEDSRKVLRQNIALKDTITQCGNVASLMIGLTQSNYELIGRSLKDVIAEPVRSAFIPGFHDLRKKALEAGALGLGISGSGPTVFALSNEVGIANQTANLLRKEFLKRNLHADGFVSRINTEGAKVIDCED
jgi:homoserine kinase